MDDYHILYPIKQLSIRIPATILSHTQLSFNQKLILGLDYTFSLKMGYTFKKSKEIGELLNLHPNIISYCRKQLLDKGFIKKKDRKYFITNLHTKFKVDDKREIIIPHQVYNNPNIITGAKLLWGEYNSISKGHKEYFAKRVYTAKRLNASEESITNWTKQLFKNGLLDKYTHKIGYCKNQKSVITISLY
ncbi:hypothetical protein Q4Q34_03225 [Flavivirga abyssicola]|uniref:hypothetical protein n=1 Tax=Flavivirga abyssicola TaxID=3063533 RepID=UPI0026E0220D|nr:hypothetical protein [Flavivirga sp. MEBiC07777]WVK14044.1 hypothetical protein Q4Q34_03225 [Flavivirga sp. MEBiC07777]